MQAQQQHIGLTRQESYMRPYPGQLSKTIISIRTRMHTNPRYLWSRLEIYADRRQVAMVGIPFSWLQSGLRGKLTKGNFRRAAQTARILTLYSMG